MNHTYSTSYSDIYLTPMTKEESQLYRVLRNVPDIRKCFIYSEEISEEAQNIWYNRYLNTDNDFMFSIYTSDNTFIGGCALYDFNNFTAEFGRVLIDRKFAGNGYACKALLALCGLASDSFKLKSLHLEGLSDNLPALKSYSKAGFIRKGSRLLPDERVLIYMEKEL